MTIFELIEINRYQLEMLFKVGVKVSDVRYIDLYQDYIMMKRSGEKITYIVTCLAEKYQVSVRKIYMVTKLFNSTANDLQCNNH